MYNLESWAYFEGKAATKATATKAAAKTESQTEAVEAAAAATTTIAVLWQNEGHNSLGGLTFTTKAVFELEAAHGLLETGDRHWHSSLCILTWIAWAAQELDCDHVRVGGRGP